LGQPLAFRIAHAYRDGERLVADGRRSRKRRRPKRGNERPGQKANGVEDAPDLVLQAYLIEGKPPSRKVR
jgi:hypothetical protein